MNSSFWEGVAWTLVTIALAVCMAWIVVGPPWANGIVGPLWVGVIKREIREARRKIIMSQQDIADQIKADLAEVKAALAEASVEITGKLDSLEAKIVELEKLVADGQPADFSAALAELAEVKEQARGLADIVPNVVEPPADGGDGGGDGDGEQPADPPAGGE